MSKSDPSALLNFLKQEVLSICKARTMVLTAVEALIDAIIQCITYINGFHEILLLEDSKNGGPGSVFIEGKNTLAI